MKTYTQKETKKLKKKYLNDFENGQLNLWGICSLVAPVYTEYALNLALLIRAAEGEL